MKYTSGLVIGGPASLQTPEQPQRRPVRLFPPFPISAAYECYFISVQQSILLFLSVWIAVEDQSTCGKYFRAGADFASKSTIVWRFLAHTTSLR